MNSQNFILLLLIVAFLSVFAGIVFYRLQRRKPKLSEAFPVDDKSSERAPNSMGDPLPEVTPSREEVEKAPTTTKKVESQRARPSLSKAIASWIPLFNSRSKDRAKWEEVLISSDMGPKLTEEILSQMEKSDDEPLVFLKHKLSELISSAEKTNQPWTTLHPFVVYLVGVNGVGKTTTTVKLANYFRSQNLKVGVVGADTFRKAAIEQLQRGCERIGVDFFSIFGNESSEGADPSAVIFDGLKKFSSSDLILVDTSGRLHNKKNLMDELRKMKKVADKALPNLGAPHEIWLIVDSTLGQNALSQGQSFHEAIGLTGLVLTKLDGLSRGGTVFQLYQRLGLPIRFVGFGETPQDLAEFNSKSFIEDLFDPIKPFFLGFKAWDPLTRVF